MPCAAERSVRFPQLVLGRRPLRCEHGDPPETELAEVDRQYLDGAHTPLVGPARLILGSYQGAVSPVRATAGRNYLLVTLADGESWTYEPPTGHTVG